ncbi:S-layer homology domain-containing protein [Marinicrinis lubricantis]|uniref:S-layer homology domain-containing protein n=1 Tax=Marinicrinis lubricantis TaxID=2086470 RepID=A0ABW1IUH3_9BACL
MNKQRMLKNMVVGGLSLAMVVGGTAGAFADGKGKGKGNDKDHDWKGKKEIEIHISFSDLDKYPWAEKNIASLASMGIFEGYADGTFKPNKNVSRLDAVVTAVRLMGLREEAESDAEMDSQINFQDANLVYKRYPNAVGYISVALKNDLFIETEMKLQPEKPADRLWTTILLVKALGLEDEARERVNEELPFKDEDKIPAAARGYVAVALENGIVYGNDKGMFQPNKPVTRAEIAAFLDRTGRLMPEFGSTTVTGQLAAEVNNNVLLIATEEGRNVQLALDPNAYIFRDGKKAAPSELEPGDELFVHTYNNVVVFVEVTKKAVEQEEQEQETTVVGTVTTNDTEDAELTLNVDGKSVEYDVYADAEIFRNNQASKLSDIKVGDVVFAKVVGNEIRYLNVVMTTEQNQFKVNGYFTGYTLNTEGKIAAISIKNSVSDDSQITIYAVSPNVKIVGNPADLVENRAVELIGSQQIITEIRIK